MRKVILEEWMSLDGHVADKNNQLDFFTQLTPEQNKYSDTDQLKLLETVDLILLGRKTYELFVEFWPTANTEQEIIADRLNSISKMVFSNTLLKAPWGHWPEATIQNGNAVEAVKELKQQHGKSMILWGSICLSQALLKAGLIDELHIQLCPVLTGGGRKLFPELQSTRLGLLEQRQYPSGTVYFNYKIHHR